MSIGELIDALEATGMDEDTPVVVEVMAGGQIRAMTPAAVTIMYETARVTLVAA